MSKKITQGRLLWCDAEANCRRLSTRAGVADIVDKASRARINALIVDVKPLIGEVLYLSKHAPRLGEIEGHKFPDSFDLLSAMIDECHSRGIEVHAAINVFSEGHRNLGRGPAYRHPEWQVTMHEAVRTIGFPGGASVRVELIDPWGSPDSPAIYTRKTGQSLVAQPGRRCITINGDTVAATYDEAGMPVEVPQDGCVLSLPRSDLMFVRPGDPVAWSAEPVFRSSAESKTPSWGVFVNPIGPARDYELRVIEEIVSGYDVDGIVFDRMRYPNLYADFGPASRGAFEKRLGREQIRWPDDVFRINERPWLPPIQGPYYKEWLEWRARQIRDFADDAVGLVRRIKPEVKAAVYVGSWYESYYDVGVNWASRNFHPGYSWMTPGYNETGFAELFDYMCTGCYYHALTRDEARVSGRPEGATVEAACQLSREAIGDAGIVYGSLYLRDYRSEPERFREAMDVTLENTAGVMLFDLVHLEDYGWWPILEEVFAEDAVAPHDA